MFKFEKLDVWQEAVSYADLAYDVTSRFLHQEQYGLISQLTRAAVSVSANIAEGSGRTSSADFSRFGRDCVWISDGNRLACIHSPPQKVCD